MNIYISLSILFAVLIIVGTFLTLVLFKFDTRALQNSGLDKKIMMWVPFAVLFILVLYLGTTARFLLFAIIIATSIFEFLNVLNKKSGKFMWLYFSLFLLSFIHLGLIRFVSSDSADILMFVIVGTVISDVCGFFFGRFFGSHKLPELFNKNKSLEGCLGQIVGALMGVLLIKYFILFRGNILVFIPIGFGSLLGDLANSRAKKIAGIKNWSTLIPGHGGFIDRFCSLAGSSILIFYFILIFLR